MSNLIAQSGHNVILLSLTIELLNTSRFLSMYIFSAITQEHICTHTHTHTHTHTNSSTRSHMHTHTHTRGVAVSAI